MYAVKRRVACEQIPLCQKTDKQYGGRRRGREASEAQKEKVQKRKMGGLLLLLFNLRKKKREILSFSPLPPYTAALSLFLLLLPL